jgi:cyclase
VIAKRIIPCLDVRAGKVTKGVQFLDNADVGDPVAMARYYYEQGADELVFYDITASNEQRGIMIDVVRAVAREIFIPFSVGGGLRTLEDMRAVLLAGAEKVSIDSGAVREPGLIAAGARAFGSQCVVLSMQVKRTGRIGLPSGHEVIVDGGRTPTGRDALQWAREGERLGAGELCINSIDADGTKAGYDLGITRMIADEVGIPVIASGGAGEPRHLLDAFTTGGADAAIVASIVHYGECTIPDLKRYLRASGVEIREAIHLDSRDKQELERSAT